jgi:hypothetical protein
MHLFSQVMTRHSFRVFEARRDWLDGFTERGPDFGSGSFQPDHPHISARAVSFLMGRGIRVPVVLAAKGYRLNTTHRNAR